MSSASQKSTILLVDDRPENLLALEAILGDFDANIITAIDGKDAVAKASEQDLAVILMDVQMPEVDGFEAAKRIREMPRHEYTPIIFVTAISKEEKFVFQGYESGAVDYMFKPLNHRVVKSKVAVFLDLERQRRTIASKEQEIARIERSLMEKRFDSGITQFINGIAHNFNNVLAGVRGYAQLVEMNPGNEAMAAKGAEQMLEGVDKMVDLVKRLREMAAQDSDEKEEFDLKELLGAMMENLRPSVSRKIALTIEEIPEVLIKASPTVFKRAFHALFTNAIEAVEPRDMPEIVVRFAAKGSLQNIIVEDNGVGMNQFGLEHATVPLYSTKEVVGVGFGLSLVKRFVEDNAGELNIESKENVGTTVSMGLPLVPTVLE